jgi:hypothetical protein
MQSAHNAPAARPARPGIAESQLVRVPRGAYALVTVFALLVGAAGIVRGTSLLHTAADSDLTTFFFPAAQQILNWHPWSIYAVRAFGGYPNYNPPLSIFLMAPFLAVANALHLSANIGALIAFVSIPFTVFVPVLGYATITALRRLFPAIPESQVFLAYVLIVLSPLTWQTYITWYHIEQPIMLALLVASLMFFQRRQEALAGVLAGVAVLTRTTAIVPLVALGVLLLAEQRWSVLARFGGVAAAVAAVGFAPFFLFDRANAMYSLVSWRGAAEIGGNSIWALVKYDGTKASSSLRYSLDHFARRLDMYTVLLFVAVVAFLAFRQLRISAYSREAWAVVAIAALAVPMLTKNNWPYYYLEPFVFILIWEFASMHDRQSGLWRWPVLTLGYLSIAASLSQFVGLQSVGFFDRVVVGFVSFAAMLAFVVAVWFRARAGKIELTAGQPAPAFRRAVGGPVPRGAVEAPGGAGASWGAGPGPQVGPGSRPFPPQQPPAGPLWPPSPSGPARPPEGWRPAGGQGGSAGSSGQWPNGPAMPPQQGGWPGR